MYLWKENEDTVKRFNNIARVSMYGREYLFGNSIREDKKELRRMEKFINPREINRFQNGDNYK